MAVATKKSRLPGLKRQSPDQPLCDSVLCSYKKIPLAGIETPRTDGIEIVRAGSYKKIPLAGIETLMRTHRTAVPVE